MAVSTESLLDRLYNLRGEDSEILKEMNHQKNIAEETKTRTTEQKGVLQNNIEDLKKQREELEDQGEKFKDVLQGINRDDYATVLNRLRIDFDPQSLLEKLNKNLPRTIESVERDTKKCEEELIKVEDEMNRAITTIEELGIRKDTALANQEKLNEYIELALSGRINITRDSITSLLEEFSFTVEEQREAAKILMFPEDALFSYDEKVKSRDKSGKSISEVIQEAKMVSVEEQVEDTKEFYEFNSSEIEVDKRKEEVIDRLREEGIDYLDFSSDEVNMLIDNFDYSTVSKNIRYIRSKGLDTDIFVNNISMMYDSELVSKIDTLISLGKDVNDIYLNPSILTKYDLDNLRNAIELISINGMNPKDIPLMAY